MEESTSMYCNLGILEKLNDESVQEIIESYNGFCATTNSLLNGGRDIAVGKEFVTHVRSLCKHGLQSLAHDHFLRSLEVFNSTHDFRRYISSYHLIKKKCFSLTS